MLSMVAKPFTWMKKRATIHQFPQEVTGFSSQYGGETSLAYVASNLVGQPMVYPNYGDETNACVFRTYGPWWDMAPSGTQKFSKTPTDFHGQDFIDLKLETAVIPEKVKIYETYHPQSVIEIYGAMVPDGDCDDVRWYKLYSEKPETESRQTSMVYEPTITQPPVAVNIIRLIIHSKHLDYYTELDAVEIVGSIEDCNGTDLDEEYTKRMERLRLSSDCNHQPPGSEPVNHFEKLPRELIAEIFSMLDFVDLCRAAPTCTLFRDHCYDSLLLLELDLQPYWSMVTAQLLDSLRTTSRVSQVQKLSVSWCSFGKNDKFSTALAKLLAECGRDLKVLRIHGCYFALDKPLLEVANCDQLTELDISSSQNVSDSYVCISHLSSLLRLNLYRSRISDNSLLEIIQANQDLQHLNLGNVSTIANYDLIAQALAKHCRNLVSLNVWRAKTFTAKGLEYLSRGCPHLEELDLGWCSKIIAQSNCIDTLVKSCPRLKKLFLTSIRTIQDSDIQSISSHCADLEQFDTLGTNYITPVSISRLLSRCSKLVFLDVSFCKQITNEDVQYWRSRFTNVDIKKSFATGS